MAGGVGACILGAKLQIWVLVQSLGRHCSVLMWRLRSVEKCVSVRNPAAARGGAGVIRGHFVVIAFVWLLLVKQVPE